MLMIEAKEFITRIFKSKYPSKIILVEEYSKLNDFDNSIITTNKEENVFYYCKLVTYNKGANNFKNAYLYGFNETNKNKKYTNYYWEHNDFYLYSNLYVKYQTLIELGYRITVI